MNADVQLFLDRQAIGDLLCRYATSLDDKDWARLATCFIADAVAVYGDTLGRQDGYRAIENTCRTALEPLDSSQHLIGTVEIQVDGDTARSRCYLHAQHTKAGLAGGDNLTIGGTYVDELVRTTEGWKIRKRELKILWQEGNPAVIGG